MKKMQYRNGIQNFFGQLGYFIAEHAWKVCILSFLCNGLLGLGMLNLPKHNLLNNNIEELYVVGDEQIETIADRLRQLFSTNCNRTFPHQYIGRPLYTEIIAWRKDFLNVLENDSVHFLLSLVQDVKNITIFSDISNHLNYYDLCDESQYGCKVMGEEILHLLLSNQNGSITLKDVTSLSSSILAQNVLKETLANYTLKDNVVVDATYIKFRFGLKTGNVKSNSRQWMDSFIRYMTKKASKNTSQQINLIFSHSDSFLEELDNDTYADIRFFSLVFTIYFFYIGFVMSGGDILTARTNIGRMGIIVTPTSILGAWGLLMACKVEFTNVIGVSPLLIVCYQILNTMITLSYVSEVSHENDVNRRVEHVVKMAVLPITASSLCLSIPFVVAIFSKYYALRLFGLYMVTTTVFNYLNHFVFYTACLAIHERRIDAGLHCCFCVKLKDKDSVKERNCCLVCCCSGSRPDSRSDTESKLENLSKTCMLRFLLTLPSKVAALVTFVLFLAAAIWGLIHFSVSPFKSEDIGANSYLKDWNEKIKNFETSSVIQIAAFHPDGYTSYHTLVTELQKQVEKEHSLNVNMTVAWQNVYKRQDYANFTSEFALIQTLLQDFLPTHTIFQNDLALSENFSLLKTVRFYLFTNTIYRNERLAMVKQKVLEIADQWNEKIREMNEDEANDIIDKAEDKKPFFKAFSVDFYKLDNSKQSLWELMIFTGVQTGVLLLFILLLQQIQFVSFIFPSFSLIINVGIIGMTQYLNVYLTSISLLFYMIAGCLVTETVLLLSHSYLNGYNHNKVFRMNLVLNTESQMLFHAIFGHFLGLFVLFAATSYVFVTYFKIILLTTAVCVVLAIWWAPSGLFYLGQNDQSTMSDSVEIYIIKTESANNQSNAKERKACI